MSSGLDTRLVRESSKKRKIARDHGLDSLRVALSNDKASTGVVITAKAIVAAIRATNNPVRVSKFILFHSIQLNINQEYLTALVTDLCLRKSVWMEDIAVDDLQECVLQACKKGPTLSSDTTLSTVVDVWTVPVNVDDRMTTVRAQVKALFKVRRGLISRSLKSAFEKTFLSSWEDVDLWWLERKSNCHL